MSEVFGPQLVSDVKCYFCGHVSGQIVTVSGGMEGRVLYAPEEVDPQQA